MVDQVDTSGTENVLAIGNMVLVSSTALLSPNIFRNIDENGRTYQRYEAGRYMLPNDKVRGQSSA